MVNFNRNSAPYLVSIRQKDLKFRSQFEAYAKVEQLIDH